MAPSEADGPANREILSSLPHTRPARRSAKRAEAAPRRPRDAFARAAARDAAAHRHAIPPAGYAFPPPQDERRAPLPGAELVEAAWHAALTWADTGLSLWSQAVRSAFSRLPRP